MSKSEEKRVETVAPGTAVVTWKEKMAAVTAKAAATEAPKGGFLSFKGGRMAYDDTPIPGDKLNVIVVDFVLENTFFKDKYNPLKPASPVCYAFGREEDEMTPHSEASEPHAPQCGIAGQEGCCEYNEWASDFEGGRGKACKNTRRIGVIPADVLTADDPIQAIKKANVVMCKLPVTSIKLFSKTINQIVKVLKEPPFSVIIELSVTPSPNQFQVNWLVKEQITDQAILQALYDKHVGVEKLMFQPYPKMEDEAAAAPKSTKY